MTKELKLSKQELEIAIAACCVGTMWDEYEGTEDFDHMVRLRLNHLIELVQKYRPSLSSNLDEVAKKIVIQLHPSIKYSAVLGDRLTMGELVELVKAGAKWKVEQFRKIEGELVSTARGWVVRTDDGRLHLMSKEDDIPALGMELHNCSDMFRELTFNDDPIEVQVTITKK